MDKENYKHFIWGENKICFPDEEFIIHMADPRCFIRYRLDEAMVGFDQFFEAVAKVQWIDGPPSEDEKRETLINAWNYLCFEEKKLDSDMGDISEDPFF